MKVLFLMANVILWSFIAQMFLPWWVVGLISFVIAFILHQNKIVSFVGPLLSIFALWFGKAWWADGNFDAPMSDLLGSLLGNISGVSVLLLTGLIGGIVAGLSGLLGSWTRTLSKTNTT